MNVSTIESCRTPREELTDEDMDTIRKLSTFMSTVLDTDQNALTLQLENNQVPQSSLDQCLTHGFQMVPRETSDILHVLSALKLLLQYGAKWDRSVLFEDQMTPYHIICQCPDDQHEMLELMIKADDGELLDAKDSEGITPLLFAVARGNLNCVKSLIRYGVDINYVRDTSTCNTIDFPEMLTPLITAIELFEGSSHTSSICRNMFDFLLKNGADVSTPDCDQRTPLMYAANIRAWECINKLVQNGARLDHPDRRDFFVFDDMALAPSLEAFKCLFNALVDKNATDRVGRSILYYVVDAGNVAAVRYILNHGVTMTKDIPTQYDMEKEHELHYDPFILAIEKNNMDVIKILEENGCQMGKSLYALRYAVYAKDTNLVQYLLFKYKYPLNQEYVFDNWYGVTTYITVLAEAACRSKAVATMLQEQGADPNKKSSKTQYVSPLHDAISKCDESTVSYLIRSGADINCRSFSGTYRNVLPFEAALLGNNSFHAAEMLLISGCSCGSYSLNIDQEVWSNTHYTELANLLKKWNVQDNNVTSLQQMCRTVILKQLSPAANKKIDELPLPVMIIKFLGIPELDDIVDNFKTWNSI